MSSFWGSLFGGANSDLNSALKNTGQLAGFSSGLGQKNTTAGSNWFNSILSGDTSKIGQAIAPEIAAGQQGVQQQKNQMAQFGNRSGGTNAASQSLGAKNRGNIINLIGGLQSGSAGNLLSSGQNLLSTALGGYNQQANLSQEQLQNWQQSILGGAITGGAAIGLGAAGKGAGLSGF